MTITPSLSIIIPARNEQDTIAATVRACGSLNALEVIVADDGSTDNTGEQASRAGARVVRLEKPRGKGAALRHALTHAKGDVLLFLDADLAAAAAEARLLLEPVASGRASMAIAAFPAGPRAGFGIATGLARWVIALLGWRRMQSPLSGQRAISKNLLSQLKIANRFGVEVALTLDAMALGARIAEIPTAMTHRRTGRTLSGFLHRARQAADVLLVAMPRLLWPVGPTGKLAGRPRMVAWLVTACIGLTACFLVGQQALRWGLFVFWSYLLLMLWLAAVSRLRFTKPNYAGRALPTSVGVAFVPTMALGWWMMGLWNAPALALGVVLALVGLLDDAFGSKERGLSGHLGALLRGRVTTGAVKAVVGGGSCIAVALWVNGWRAWPGLMDGLLIALCANALNLLDLRPGRALKGFAALAALALAFEPTALATLGPLLVAVAVYAPLDLCEQVMMGDAGSNALGGIVGLFLAVSLPAWGRAALLLALGALHAFCERRSLSQMIDRAAPLRWLDNLGRPYS